MDLANIKSSFKRVIAKFSTGLLTFLLCCVAGAQPALHFVGGNFHKISFDDVIVLIQSWCNFFANGNI